ncbi:MAG: dynamin family protein [Candidatus Thiodiazotropha sp. (ex Lucinoma borealis)]|nr:dynamin family protein [Candidatus Thiodiazotropha sp. (ex Troendleina suluensis)]MCU7863349.1 dynamin family protein [Candidatus Thiodiazotropha sp. (ex Lucinoma borealis)]MCU7868121.1 dynamin family protein [Candidatus Thiodiazotropha sp. (ex Lucinoma borealis)]MCU7946819.1 dynamin family protein [Candidatus Thiodiazotropha sp. (ex Cardiolucina cf. quadrata)]
MEKVRFQEQLLAYEQWKKDVINTIEEYAPWLEENGMSSQDIQQRIEHTLSTLKSDKLTIAFVAEFSRGKTELINAIFFADYGRRLLPSDAGRTTMCPTEIFYDDERDEAYVRLLPIETRLQDTTLTQLRHDTKQWVHYPLEVDSVEQMQAALREVIETKSVTLDEAKHLGLYSQDLHPHQSQPPEMIEIPKWRHALISFPHHMLQKGLTILDTPGLNALGTEPELTLNMLPAAQAVLFVLGADTGVTRSDMEIWQHHIKGFQSSRQRGLMVVLNKIDTLWDDLREHEDIHDAIRGQQRSSAEMLGIESKAVFPISAQKGLLAKIRNEPALLDKSGLLDLENYLGQDVLNIKQQIILDTVSSDVGQMLDNSRSMLSGKLNDTKYQLEELEELSDKSDDVINNLMEKTRSEQAQYLRDVETFQQSRKQLKQQAQQLSETLSLDLLDDIIDRCRKEMTNSWTTSGMKGSMKNLFEETRRTMLKVVTQSEQTRKLIRSIYRKFQNEHGFAVVQPKMFSIVKYRVELELLHQEAEIFRNSPVTAMMEQNFVVKRFFSALVKRARDIFQRADEEINTWLRSTLEPLVMQIKDHKEMMEKRLNNLQKIGQSRNTLQYRILELQEQYTELARQLTALRNMSNRLSNNRPLHSSQRQKPTLVKQNAS